MNKLDPNKISDESVIKLAAAILKSAADDYRKALVKENALRRYMYSNGSEKYIEYIYAKGELETLRKFFRSQWCGILLTPTKLNGEDVMKKIEKEVLGKRRF